MVPVDNPAGRLYAVLSKANSHKGGKRACEVWAAVFGVEAGEPLEIYRHLYLMQTTLREAQDTLERIPDLNRKLFLRCFPKIEEAIAPRNQETVWNKFQQHLARISHELLDAA
jgi:hypothetical protein